MYTLFSVIRVLHILAASSSLLLLIVPLVAAKGSPIHRRAGWAWVITMAFVVATGLGISIGYLAAPTTFHPGGDPSAVRNAGLFLSLLGMMTASAVWQGVRAIGRKRAPAGSRHPIDLGLPSLVVLLGLGVLALGATQRSLLLAFFGITAAFVAGEHLLFAVRPLPSKMAWWYGHMNGMLGAVIAAITAFSIAGLRRMLPLPTEIAFLPWIAPPLLLSPLFTMWVRYYRRQFGDRPSRERAVAHPEVI